MESECGSRDFGTSLQFLSVNPVEAECMMIEKAVSGVGTDEKVLASIVCGRSNKDLELLKVRRQKKDEFVIWWNVTNLSKILSIQKKYFDLYSKDLGQLVASELGGNMEKLIINVMQADEEEFDPGYHNQEKMEEDAVKLYKMGQGEIGSDEVGLFKIMVKSPPQYLHKLNMFYADKYGYTLPKVLEKELGGELEFCAEFMLNMKLKPFEAIAEMVNDACEGFGTHELLLTVRFHEVWSFALNLLFLTFFLVRPCLQKTLLIRYEPIMKKVDQAHQELYGKSIEERVQSETGGDYRAILKEVVATGMSM